MRFTPRLFYSQGRRPWSSLSKRLDGTLSRCGRFGEEVILFYLPGIKPRFLGRVSSRITQKVDGACFLKTLVHQHGVGAMRLESSAQPLRESQI